MFESRVEERTFSSSSFCLGVCGLNNSCPDGPSSVPVGGSEWCEPTDDKNLLGGFHCLQNVRASIHQLKNIFMFDFRHIGSELINN